MKRARLSAVVVAAMATSCAATTGGTERAPSTRARRLVAPALGSLYHGVFPGGAHAREDTISEADVAAYEAAVGRRVAWVYFSSEWGVSRAFPRATAEWITRRGAIPFVRLMLRSSLELGARESVFTSAAIARGDFDADLHAWAAGAHNLGAPLLIEWGTEANGDWFPWSREGAVSYRAAFRHIVEVFRAERAPASFVFHVHVPDAHGARFEAYWPGGDVVDWIGFSIYATGGPSDRAALDFTAAMSAYVARASALAPHTPVLIAEMGADVANRNVDAARWAEGALVALLAGRWPSVRGFAWWSSRFANAGAPDTEMRVAASPSLTVLFRRRLAASSVLDRPVVR
jgi:hypothetical protein